MNNKEFSSTNASLGCGSTSSRVKSAIQGASHEQIIEPELAQATSAKFLSKSEVADLLGCSPRHVDRLRKTGKLPTAIKLGALVRWPRQALLNWIEAGCPAIKAP